MASLWRILRTGFLQYGQALSVELSYRAAFLQTLVSELVGMVGVLMFWIVVGKSATSNYGYNTELLVTYFVFAAALGILADDGLARNLSMDIRSGKLSASLLRPHPFVFLVTSRSLAFVTVRVIVLLPLLAGALAFVPEGAAHLRSMTFLDGTLILLSLILALIAGWAVKSMVGLLAFRLTQTWGPELIYLSIFSIASGERYPPDILPQLFRETISWSPFYYMIGFPTLVVTGRLTDAATLDGLLRGSLVAGVCMAITYGLWRKGLQRFEAVGI